jgi:hypothetical protein
MEQNQQQLVDIKSLNFTINGEALQEVLNTLAPLPYNSVYKALDILRNLPSAPKAETATASESQG